MPTVSIVIPVYNEKNTLRIILKAAEGALLPDLEKEIIIVDDGSTDGTRDLLADLEKTGRYRIFYQPRNRGKGSALRLGFQHAKGDFVIIQDADLEYNPQEYPLLLAPLRDGNADVVYGSRFVGGSPHRVLYFWHDLGNRFLTLLSNAFTNLNLTDMETGYKAFTRRTLQTILPQLRSQRFGIEPEITAGVARHKLRVYEVGVSYSGRTYEEGKKAGWKDGFAAIWYIIKYNVFR